MITQKNNTDRKIYILHLALLITSICSAVMVTLFLREYLSGNIGLGALLLALEIGLPLLTMTALIIDVSTYKNHTLKTRQLVLASIAISVFVSAVLLFFLIKSFAPVQPA